MLKIKVFIPLREPAVKHLSEHHWLKTTEDEDPQGTRMQDAVGTYTPSADCRPFCIKASASKWQQPPEAVKATDEARGIQVHI